MGSALVGLARFGLVLAAALMLAAAAAPDQLPSEVRGVVGSGDQLRLQLKDEAGAGRTIRVGEEYRDGWVLQALSPTKATLAKDGETRDVGLNPDGRLASSAPAAPPSVVTLAGVPDEAEVARILSAAGPVGAIPVGIQPGLTEAESRRSRAYLLLTSQEVTRRRDAAMAAGETASMSLQDVIALLGQAAYDDRMALALKAAAGAQAAAVADLAARPVSGPTTYYVPAGGNEAQVVAAQGIDRRGVWEPSPLDAQGGRTFTLTAATAEQYAARAAAGPLPPQMAPPPPPPRPASLSPPSPGTAPQGGSTFGSPPR